MASSLKKDKRKVDLSTDIDTLLMVKKVSGEKHVTLFLDV